MPVDILETALQAAQSVRHDFLASDLTYRRGSDSFALQGTPGRSFAEAADDDGTVREVELDDWIVRAADLVDPFDDGEAFEPRPGDLLDRVDSAGHFRRFELNQLPGARCWRYASGQRLDVRLHSKRVHEADLLAWDYFTGSGDVAGSEPDTYGSPSTWAAAGTGTATRLDTALRTTADAFAYFDLGVELVRIVTGNVLIHAGGGHGGIVIARDGADAFYLVQLDPAADVLSIERVGTDPEQLAAVPASINITDRYRFDIITHGEWRIQATLKNEAGITVATVDGDFGELEEWPTICAGLGSEDAAMTCSELRAEAYGGA